LTADIVKRELNYMKIALVGIFPDGTVEYFKNMLSENEFEIKVVDTIEKYQKLEDANVIVLRLRTITRADIERNKDLKLIQKWGAGFDTIDIEAAGEYNIPVSNAPGANAYAVAEIAVMHMLAVYRNLIIQDDAMRKGVWTKTEYTNRSYCLLDKTVGLIGGGNISKEVAKRVQAFGSKVQYYDIYRMKPEDEERLNMKYVELEELYKTSDVISIHVPLMDSTRHMIDKKAFDIMKPTTIVINTSRGGLINEKDLIDALENNRILGAGLDCIENEPVKTGDPILSVGKVTLTPHVGGTSADLLNHMCPLMVDNIMGFSKGDGAKYVVNKKYMNNN
jgi:D-3-phosphoglycerate dehydrogenase